MQNYVIVYNTHTDSAENQQACDDWTRKVLEHLGSPPSHCRLATERFEGINRPRFVVKLYIDPRATAEAERYMGELDRLGF